MAYSTEIVKTIQPDFAELFTFQIGIEYWRYTSYSTDVTFDGKEYLATAIQRGEWSQEIDMKPLNVKITVPISEVAAKFVSNFPAQKVSITIIRVILESPANYWTLFQGAVNSVLLNKNVAELECESSSLLYSFRIPRVIHQAFCNNKLFDSVCSLNSESYAVALTNITVTGSAIVHATIDTYADGYFTWGRAKTNYNDERMITNHIGNTITLQVPFDTRTITGGRITLYPGCDKNFATCKGKYANLSNFVGFPYIPSNNPAIFGVEQTE